MKNPIDYLCKQDVIFKMIIEKYGIPKTPKRPEGFETLVLLILEQQVSIDSAKATFLKLKAQEKNFQPQELLNLLDEEFRDLGVSRQKTSYIKALATAILNNDIDLESLRAKSGEEVREELIKIKGIGNWTIDVYCIFCLQDPDLLPLGDVAVVNTIKELFLIESKEEMEIYGLRWSPHRSMATFLLWHYYLQKRGRNLPD
jgi:DNA-3-methyladenine glycosylase II